MIVVSPVAWAVGAVLWLAAGVATARWIVRAPAPGTTFAAVLLWPLALATYGVIWAALQVYGLAHGRAAAADLARRTLRRLNGDDR